MAPAANLSRFTRWIIRLLLPLALLLPLTLGASLLAPPGSGLRAEAATSSGLGAEAARASTTTDAGREDAPTWTWPLHPVPAVLRPFDLSHHYAAGHRGVDLEAAAGTPVLAPDDGVVHFAGWVVDRPVLSIAHSNGLISSVEPVMAAVERGDAVARGQVVGHVSTEHTHAPSGGLHLGARDGDTYIDPLALLGAVPRAVLLPLSTDDP